jgi:hypothetical protein
MFRDKDRKEILEMNGRSITQSQKSGVGSSDGKMSHLMPNVVAGDTPLVDNELAKMFYSNDGTKQEAFITYYQKNEIYPYVADS